MIPAKKSVNRHQMLNFELLSKEKIINPRIESFSKKLVCPMPIAMPDMEGGRIVCLSWREAGLSACRSQCARLRHLVLKKKLKVSFAGPTKAMKPF